jgi:hypothetical protein
MPVTRPDNDIFCVVASKDDDDVWSSVPTEWGTAVYDVVSGTSTRHTMWAWKGAGEPASYSISHDNEVTEFTVLRITGGDADDIIEAFDTDVGSSAQATAPEVTPTNSNTLVLRNFGCDRRALSNLPVTNEVNVGGGGANDCSLAVSFADGPSGGSGTGTATADLASSDEWVAATACINEKVVDPVPEEWAATESKGHQYPVFEKPQVESYG